MSTAVSVKPLKRRHIAAMTPTAVEFLRFYIEGWSVSALARYFGWHPLAVIAAKRNFYHVHKVSPIRQEAFRAAGFGGRTLL